MALPFPGKFLAQKQGNVTLMALCLSWTGRVASRTGNRNLNQSLSFNQLHNLSKSIFIYKMEITIRALSTLLLWIKFDGMCENAS